MGNQNFRLFDVIGIDINTAQKMFSEYDKKVEVASLTLITEGSSTSNYIVDIKNSDKKYLLKIYPENGGNSAVEVASYFYAKQYINVPEIYFFDESKKVYNSPYMIMNYINGISLKEYVVRNKKFPEEFAYDIGSKLALIHSREYKNMALLNKDLEINKILLPITELHEYYLNGIAGTHINSKIKYELLEFIKENTELLNKLGESFVYSHGDFSSSNILIDTKDSSIWVIDFEYSLAAPPYYDIGKFFRDNEKLNKYREKNIYDNFINGYNAHGKRKVTDDWIKLARLMDITGILGLINKENPHKQWVLDIEDEIAHSMRVLKNEALF